MISYEQAIEILDEAVRPLPARRLELVAAAGLRLAGDAMADINAPPGDVSAMDGYAVRASDLAEGTPLEVTITVPAGSQPGPLGAGAAARIFTGALLPSGADTVVPQEQAVRQGDRVTLEPLPSGSHVRHQGEVFASGQCLARAGERLTPARVALLAAGGASRVDVIPRPRMAVVLTGSELVPADRQPGPGQIRDANGPMLDALALEAGLVLPPHLAAADEADTLREVLSKAAAQADLVVTSGGVSVGDLDLVPDTILALGGEIVLHRARIKPGKPILAARLGAVWVLGLPGNPVSVMACWRLFGDPMVRRLAGDEHAFAEPPITAILQAPCVNHDRRTVFMPGVLHAPHGSDTGLPRVSALDWKGSHDLVAAARATALIRIEPGTRLEAGVRVECFALSPKGPDLPLA